MKKLLWLLLLIPVPFVVAAFPTNGPPQNGFDSTGAGHPIYVDANGNQYVVVTSGTTPLPDAGNPGIPLDMCNSVWHQGLVLCGNTPTKIPASNLIGRKSLLITNNGPNSIWFGQSAVGADDAGTNMGTTLLSTQSATLTFGSNIQVYCISETPQATPTKGNPNGTSYNECY